MGSRNVARSPRAATGGGNGVLHGIQNHRMLAHTQIIVAAPDGDFFMGREMIVQGLRKFPPHTVQGVKGAIPPFLPNLG